MSTRSRSASRSRRSVSWTMPSRDPAAGADVVLLGRQAEQDHAADAEGRERPGVLQRLVGRHALHAGHGPDGLAQPVAGEHEQRRDQLAGVDPRLAHERPEASRSGASGGGGGPDRGSADAGRRVGRRRRRRAGSSGVSGGGWDGSVVEAGDVAPSAAAVKAARAPDAGDGATRTVAKPSSRATAAVAAPAATTGVARRRAGRASPAARASSPRAVEPLVRTSDVERTVVERGGEQRRGRRGASTRLVRDDVRDRRRRARRGSRPGRGPRCRRAAPGRGRPRPDAAARGASASPVGSDGHEDIIDPGLGEHGGGRLPRPRPRRASGDRSPGARPRVHDRAGGVGGW